MAGLSLDTRTRAQNPIDGLLYLSTSSARLSLLKAFTGLLALWACQKLPLGSDLGWNRQLSGECRIRAEAVERK
jgi:hypothetical protein